MRTPRSSRTRRSSRASLAGCTVARSGVKTPPLEARRVCDSPRLGGVHRPQAVAQAVPLEQRQRRVGRGRAASRRPGRRGCLRGRKSISGVVALAPATELGDLVAERGGPAQAGIVAEAPAELAGGHPRRREEAAVGAAAAGAADGGLEQHDAQRRLALGELVGRPEAGETAADDADVGLDLAGERRARHAGIGGQRLVQPVAARADRRHLRLRSALPASPVVHVVPPASLLAMQHTHRTHHEGQTQRPGDELGPAGVDVADRRDAPARAPPRAARRSCRRRSSGGRDPERRRRRRARARAAPRARPRACRARRAPRGSRGC